MWLVCCTSEIRFSIGEVSLDTIDYLDEDQAQLQQLNEKYAQLQ